MADNLDTGALPPPDKKKRALKNPLGLGLQVLLLFLNLLYSLAVATFHFFVPPQQKDITGQVVLITGTGRGLGQALAIEFARNGAKVACAEIQTDLNENTVKLINEYAPGAGKGYFCDVGKLDSVQELKAAVLKDFGRVDIVVHNAAVIAGGGILGKTFSSTIIENVTKVNFLSHMWLANTFLPEIVARNSGHLVAISSMSALCGLANGSLYTSCKWAVTGFMESIREELRLNVNNQVQTSVVLPFFINTSAEYVKNWDVRMPELSVDRCAKAVVKGVRENQVIFSIPRDQYYAVSFVKLLPMAVRDQFFDIFHAKIKSQEKNTLHKFTSFKIASGDYIPKKTT